MCRIPDQLRSDQMVCSLMLKYMKSLALAFLLSVGAGGEVGAASFDCSEASTETEIAICADPVLSALDELARILSKYVGLVISFDEIDANYDDISEHYSLGINSLLRNVAQPHIGSLMDDIANLSTWDAELYPGNVLIIRPQINGPQEVLIIFGESHFPLFFEMEHILNAFSVQYSVENNVLFVRSFASPATIIEKYRWQNGCWRLIGSDRYFNHRGYNPDNDPIELSINTLTGQEILYYDNGNSIARTFDPEVWCIGEGKYISKIY